MQQTKRENLARFFDRARRDSQDCVLAWEPRGWPPQQAEDVCRALGLLRVMVPFKDPPSATGRRYFRLHGLRGYTGQYGDTDLKRLAARCRRETWCMFNNVHMVDDATRFQALLRPQGSAEC